MLSRDMTDSYTGGPDKHLGLKLLLMPVMDEHCINFCCWQVQHTVSVIKALVLKLFPESEFELGL